MNQHKWITKDYVYLTAECVIGAFTVLGNGLVLMAIYKTRALRTVTNCFIGSLALADTLVGFVVPPTAILSYLELPMNFLDCVFINTVAVLITTTSILNLLTIALERYLAISDPFRYQRLMTIKRAMVVVAVTWIIAILIGLLPVMGWHLGSDGFKICAFTRVIDMKYMVYLIFFGVNISSFLFMLIIYTYIFHIIRRQQRRTEVAQLSELSQDELQDMLKQKREIRGAEGLACVVILFAVCWLPLHIMNCVSFFTPEKSGPPNLLLVTIVMSHANSSVNPFLYALSNYEFKRAIKRIVCWCTDQSNDDPSFSKFATAGTSRTIDTGIMLDSKTVNSFQNDTLSKAPCCQEATVSFRFFVENLSEKNKTFRPKKMTSSSRNGAANETHCDQNTHDENTLILSVS